MPRKISIGESGIEASFVSVVACSWAVFSRAASLIIAQVNREMPWTLGDSLISVHDLDVLVPCDEPLLEINLPTPNETSRCIAKNAAALIPDGSTVGFGIDRVSIALPEFLKQKHDLGIHAEVISDAIVEMTGKRLGMSAIIDASGRVVGVYTDGDLRRTLEKGVDMRNTPVAKVMTRNAISIRPDALAVDAAKLMQDRRIQGLLVIDEEQILVGALNFQDLLHSGVV